jgi:outer membrane protein
MNAIFGAFAQKNWTLESCIETALQNNITVKQRKLSTRSAQADLFQSKMNMLPAVNAQATNNWNVGFVINPVTNSTETDATFRNNGFGLNANMTVFNGFQTLNNIRLQQSNVKSGQLDEETTKNNIALQVSNAFMQVLMNTEIALSRKLQVEATRAQLVRQQKMYDLGGVNKTRLLQLKAQLANEELLVVNADNQLAQSYLSLWQSMNVAPDSAQQIVRPELDASKITDEARSSEQVYEAFVQKSPELKAAKERARAAHINTMIARGARSPRLTFGGGLNSFYTTQNQRGVGNPILTPVPFGVDVNGNPVFALRGSYASSEIIPFSTQFDQNLGRNYGFTLSLPIFNGWQANTGVQKSKINKINADLTEQLAKQDAYRNVNQAYLDFKSALKRYDANEQNLAASKESFEMADAQYTLGNLSINEYLSTKNTYLQAETNFVQAKYELMFRRKVLDFYLGQPLFRNN